MNDRRTLLGFLLIGLIFLLSPYYYEWMGLAPQPERPVEKERDKALAPAKPSPSPQERAPSLRTGTATSEYAEPSPPADEDFAPRPVRVQTPLFELVFTTQGGVLLSCQLRHYHLPGGPPVQLLSPRGKGLVLLLRQGEFQQDLSRVEFTPDADTIVLEEGQATLKLSAQLDSKRRLERIFTFYADRYAFDHVLHYEGFDEDVEAVLAWQGGIPFTERDMDIDLPEMGAIASFNEERIEVKVDEGESESWTDKGALDWVGVRTKYFLSALVPQGEGRFRAALSGDRRRADPLPDYRYEVGRRLSARGSWASVVYLGPLNYDNLIRYQVGLEQAIDFGWPIVSQISKFLLIVFKATHNYIPNYGWIIVIFAVVIKIIVYPLTHKTYESAGKMQELQPKIAALREKYKNDNQRLSQETMKLYKEEGVNPLGGCLPMLLQMPIFISLYNIFGKTIELRQAPFVLWIDDLSLPDEVVVGGFGLHILPLLMALSMLVQQKMTMKDPKQAFLVYFMPVFMIFIFWHMSSGLVLYWTLFNILTILQQLLVNHLKAKPAGPAKK